MITHRTAKAAVASGRLATVACDKDPHKPLCAELVSFSKNVAFFYRDTLAARVCLGATDANWEPVTIIVQVLEPRQWNLMSVALVSSSSLHPVVDHCILTYNISNIIITHNDAG